MAGRRMHYQAGGFIDHEQVFILVGDIELYVFRLVEGLGCMWYFQLDFVAGKDLVTRSG